MLDALRHNKTTSRARGTSPRRGGHAQSVMSSLGYGTEGSPAGGRNTLRLVLVAVGIGLVAVLAYQGATKYNVLGMFTGGDQATSLAERVKRDPPAPAPARDGAKPAAPDAASASAVPPVQAPPQDAAPAPVPETQVATEVDVKDHARDDAAPAAERSAAVAEREEPRAPAPRNTRVRASTRPAQPRVAASSTDEPVVPAATPRSTSGGAPVYTQANGETDHFKSALYYHRMGNFENALVQYKAVLAVNEMNAEAHNNLGLLYQDKGLMEEAIVGFRRAAAIDHTYAKAHNNLGVALLRTGKVDAAAQEFRLLLAQEPRNVDAMTNLATALKSSSGRLEEARELLQRALSIDGRNATAHYNLALILEESGDIIKAIEHYEFFLSFGGGEQAAMAADTRARVVNLQARIQRLQ